MSPDDHPNLETREIAAIDAVACSRSFRLAADLLHTTQPSLSRLIARAESRLGADLFRRGWSGAETTPAGDVAARSCASMLAAITDVERRLFGDRRDAPRLGTTVKSAHLRAIEAVTRDGSVSVAARRLGVGQPDLSRALSDFGKRFGIDLFRRSATGMEPLDTARILTELNATLTFLQNGLKRQLTELAGVVSGRVSVGMLPFSGQDLIAIAFARLANAHPNVRLSCVPGSYNGLIEALRRREIDRIIGVLRSDRRPEGIEEHHLYDERFTVVARRDHPIRDADMAALARTHWIVAPHGTPVRTHFEAVFAELSLTPPTQTCEMLSFSAAEQMLVESDSLAMLTYSARKLATLRHDLRAVPTGFPAFPAPVGSMKLHGTEDDAALSAFDAILKGVVADNAQAT